MSQRFSVSLHGPVQASNMSTSHCIDVEERMRARWEEITHLNPEDAAFQLQALREERRIKLSMPSPANQDTPSVDSSSSFAERSTRRSLSRLSGIAASVSLFVLLSLLLKSNMFLARYVEPENDRASGVELIGADSDAVERLEGDLARLRAQIATLNANSERTVTVKTSDDAVASGPVERATSVQDGTEGPRSSVKMQFRTELFASAPTRPIDWYEVGLGPNLSSHHRSSGVRSGQPSFVNASDGIRFSTPQPTTARPGFVEAHLGNRVDETLVQGYTVAAFPIRSSELLVAKDGDLSWSVEAFLVSDADALDLAVCADSLVPCIYSSEFFSAKEMNGLSAYVERSLSFNGGIVGLSDHVQGGYVFESGVHTISALAPSSPLSVEYYDPRLVEGTSIAKSETLLTGLESDQKQQNGNPAYVARARIRLDY